jgi:hypothetical protein
LLEDGHDRTEQLALERAEARWASISDESEATNRKRDRSIVSWPDVGEGSQKTRESLPDQRRDRLERVLVELGVTRVPADVTDDVDETLEDGSVDGSEGLTGGEDDSHDACSRWKIYQHAKVRKRRNRRWRWRGRRGLHRMR